MPGISRAKVEALQNRQLLLSVKLVQAAHTEPCVLTHFQRFDALALAYHMGLWNGRQFKRARELLGLTSDCQAH